MRPALEKFGHLMVDETALLDPEYLDEAIAEVEKHRVLYSYDRLIHAYQKHEGWTIEEAFEWVWHNTIPSLPYMGQYSPEVIHVS